MNPGSQRRYVGGAEPIRDAGREDPSQKWHRWQSDPVWQSANVPPEATPANAVEVGDWPLGRIRTPAEGQRGWSWVRSQIPDQYDAYLRVLYPFVGPEVIENGRTIGHQLTTWHDTATANGRTPHRLMDVVGIGPDHSDMHGGHFPYQNLASDQANALYDVLERHTRSQTSWFLLWDGDYYGSAVPPESSKVYDGIGMGWYAFQGPLWACDGFWSPPRWWWPNDRAWCYQTNIDSDLTNCAYLGASAACVEEILDNTTIEAVIAYPGDPIISTDTVNRPGAG